MTQALTAAQLLLQDILPPDIYQGQPLDKKEIRRVLGEVARKYPEQYEDISFKLVRLGLFTGESLGGASFGIDDLRTAKIAKDREARLRREIRKIWDSEKDPKKRKEKIQLFLAEEAEKQRQEILDESEREQNRFALQLKGAGRGNPGSLASMRGGSVAVFNAKGEIAPVPVTKGYSEGVTPLQYLALEYGARKGLTTTKLGVAEGGYMSKLLSQSAHRMIVTDEDTPNPPKKPLGIIRSLSEPDLEGYLLAQPAGGYPKDTPLTPKLVAELRRKGVNRVVLRSPIASIHPAGGLYAKDVGIIETGRLPVSGDHVGMKAAQAIGEIATQARLSAKHEGGRGKLKTDPGLSGFELIDNLVNLSPDRLGFAAHAHVTGRITKIEKAPQGGHFVYVGNAKTYVPQEFTVTVKPGQTVEAGDVVSNGVPNPAIITRYRGIGEGRLAFVDGLNTAMKGSVNRRQLEILASGLIDRVRFNDFYDSFFPGDIAPYSRVAAIYKARRDSKEDDPQRSVGKYLDEPVLHYSIGTPITPRIAQSIREAGINRVMVNDKPPPFEPEIVRGMDLLSTDPDFMTRQLGAYTKRNIVAAAHFGAESDPRSTSFVPAVAKGEKFPSFSEV
ncbi:MAG: hypothetical protein KatS3mg109_0131 [Pirellulaceae bacterium]|nr:MAG: hypothetical protein KatS3mg109_0131 [Pirellulaceae bacterium]